jgi:hypothetical protein
MLVDNIGKRISFSSVSGGDDTTGVTSLSNIAREYNIYGPCGRSLINLGLEFSLEKLGPMFGPTFGNDIVYISPIKLEPLFGPIVGYYSHLWPS